MPNHLLNETSPYLKQHAQNPVDWYAWGKEPLAKAKLENRVILLSIGYSACHWCHVMEHESFEDPAIAALMNRHFVNIKVDREERPDIDQIYMDAVQAITGSGGWPLHVFLTPDLKPFFGGTYFPPVRSYNRSSWKEVLLAIADAWQNKQTEMIAQAENLTEHIRQLPLLKPNDALLLQLQGDLDLLTSNLLLQADTTWGGFGQAPKFPQTQALLFLLRQSWFLKNRADIISTVLPNQPEEHALLSLRKMYAGGIFDHVGGGFARYSTDAQWHIPHFEKMLYDNALLLNLYAEAFQASGEPEFKKLIQKTLDHFDRAWLSQAGGLFSAYDADSEGVEGKFYSWQKEEILDLLSDTPFTHHFCTLYGIKDEGNWEHTNILWLPQSLVDYCDTQQLDKTEFSAMVEDALATLYNHRKKRIGPALDHKCILGWNALYIKALCNCGQALTRPDYFDKAEKLAAYIYRNLKTEQGTYLHHETDGTPGVGAFLDDLAYWADACSSLYQVTGKAGYLETCLSIVEQVEQFFSVPDSPYFYFTHQEADHLITRKQDLYDGATPSGNSVLAGVYYFLWQQLGIQAHQVKAHHMLTGIWHAVVKYPLSFSNWALLAQKMGYGGREVVITGQQAAAYFYQLASSYFPDITWAWTNDLAAANLPLFNGRQENLNETKVFICQNQTCEIPVLTISSAQLALKGGKPRLNFLQPQ